MTKKPWIWAAVPASVLVGLGLGAWTGLPVTTTHHAAAQLLVSPGTPEKGRNLTEMSGFVQSRMESWAALADSASVINPVLESLALQEDVPTVMSRLDVQVPAGSTMLVLNASGESEEEAIALADAAAASLSREIMRTTPKQTGGEPSIAVVSAQTAKDVRWSETTNPSRRGAVGGALAGLAATGAVSSLRTRGREEKEQAAWSPAGAHALAPAAEDARRA
ncbi:hypothetical protein ACTQ49_06865 [Luteococcus sp. Sow4_B9]|uniref:hypothetical protein n=1 Tax=Luteococcus sp. Sow4_B9 TaxID=3438792 RepID=UPI003F9467C2